MNSSAGKHWLAFATAIVFLLGCTSGVSQPVKAPAEPGERPAEPALSGPAGNGDAGVPAETGPGSGSDDLVDEALSPEIGDPAGAESDVMYRVLAAEALGTEGDLRGAAENYVAAALESDDPEIARRATEVSVAAQAWQYASMAADRWVVLEPGNILARETAVKALLLGGDFVQAEIQIEDLLERLRDEPWEGWDRIAALLAAAHTPSRTRRMLERLVEAQGAEGNPYALLCLSQVEARGGDVQESRRLAQEAVAMAPGEAELQVWAGRLALTARDLPSAAKHYRAAWAADPADRARAMAYAELLLQMGDAAGANKVLAELPDTPENRFTRIGIAARTGDTVLAEELYQGFSKADYEDSTEGIFAAARSAELLDRDDEAIGWYERLDGTERELAGRVRRAALNAKAGRVDEARAILQAVRNESNASMQLETMVLEAQILVDANRANEAYDVLSQAREQFPDDARLLYTRALVAVTVDRIEEAERDLRQVIGQDPSNAGALNALGYTLADRGERLDEAESLIRAAYELQPEEPAIIDSMGWIAYRRGRLAEAETFLRRAFLRDRNAEIAAHLGEVLWSQDKRRDAIVVWAEGLKIDADNTVLNDTLQRLGVSL